MTLRQSVSLAVTSGLATALAMWCAWLISHMPELQLPEQIAILSVLAVWIVAPILSSRWVGGHGRPLCGAASGFITSLAGLLILGSKISAAQMPDSDGSGAPPVAVVVFGFLVLGAFIGATGAVFSGLVWSRGDSSRLETDARNSLGRLAIVAIAAAAVLVFIGGMVTSTDSGMAVYDWPNTFGSNMFLYPIGPRTEPKVFREHSHRLFGTFLGLASIVLCVWSIRRHQGPFRRAAAISLLALVIAQGVIGGYRVRHGSADPEQDNRMLALVHGVLAQLTCSMLVLVAILVSPTFDRQRPAVSVVGRRLRFMTTGFLHSSLLQLLFGALYRHTRSPHALYTHAGFSLVVLSLGLLAGLVAVRFSRDRPETAGTLGIGGKAAIALVSLQFCLGWAAFFVAGSAFEARSATEAIIRTLHQTNGAATLSLATFLFAWTRWLGTASPTNTMHPRVEA